MSFVELRESVLDAELCTSCGLCAAVCPEELLTIDVDHTTPTVRLADNVVIQTCGCCSLCLDVCPGRDTGVPASERRLFGRARSPAEHWSGIVRDVYVARARHAKALAAASAGGAATALLIAALRSGRIEAALVIGRDAERPWIPEARLATTEAEVIECAQATYCITPNLQVLRDAPYDRVGMVGLPCQVEAIQKMRNLPRPPALAETIALMIEIACSSNTPRAATEHLIAERLGVELTDVADMHYRSGDYPGEFTVVDTADERHTLPFHEIVPAFKRFKTFRCKACPDWWSGLADISVSDGDPNIFKTSRNGESTLKSSLVVTRTDRGAELVADAVSGDVLEITPGRFDWESNLGLQRKIHRYERLRAKHPRRVPTRPSDFAPKVDAVSDTEVIERLSPPAPPELSRAHT